VSRPRLYNKDTDGTGWRLARASHPQSTHTRNTSPRRQGGRVQGLQQRDRRETNRGPHQWLPTIVGAYQPARGAQNQLPLRRRAVRCLPMRNLWPHTNHEQRGRIFSLACPCALALLCICHRDDAAVAFAFLPLAMEALGPVSMSRVRRISSIPTAHSPPSCR
jgi:hypothetical protein